MATSTKAKPTVRVDWSRSRGGWTVGTVSYKSATYRFSIKNFIEGSVYGIDNGCVSKMSITSPDGEWIVNYDRGWDIRPKSSDAKAVMRAILDRFNHGMSPRDLAKYMAYSQRGF